MRLYSTSGDKPPVLPGPGPLRTVPLRAALAVGILILLVAFPAGRAAALEVESGRHKAQAAAVRLAEVLTPWEKSHLGLGAGNAKNISLGRPLTAYSISQADLAQARDGVLGGFFKETGLVFWPVRVAGRQRAGVWLKRTDENWQAVGVGEKAMASSLSRAAQNIAPALRERDINDSYLVRLLVLDWAASRFLAVLVRDRLLVWPLPSAAALLNLKPDFYPFFEIRPMLTGRSLE